jgi:hypothetical protein
MGDEAVPPEVEGYFDALDGEKRDVVLPVFETVRDAMPEGYRLGVQWRMPGWVVPLERFPDTYNKQPLAYVSLGAQKNYNSLYLMAIYSDTDEDRRFREAWARGGRALHMGKSCLRFRTLDDVDLDLIAETVAAFPVERFLATYQRIRG